MPKFEENIKLEVAISHKADKSTQYKIVKKWFKNLQLIIWPKIYSISNIIVEIFSK